MTIPDEAYIPLDREEVRERNKRIWSEIAERLARDEDRGDV